MSITYHERPGVYSDYDASSVTATGSTERVIALAGVSEAKSGLYTVTSYASGRDTFGESSQLGRMLKLAYQNGAGTVLACPVAEDTEAAYQAALALVFVALIARYRLPGAKSHNLTVGAGGTYRSYEQLSRPRQYTFRDPDNIECDTSDYSSRNITRTDRDQPGYDVNGNVSYTRSLSKRSRLSFEYRINYTDNSVERNTFVLTKENVFPDERNPKQSTEYDYAYLTHRIGSTYQYYFKKTKIAGTLHYQHAAFSSDYAFPYARKTETSFDNLTYSVVANINVNRNNTLKFNASGRTSNPRATDLQDIVNTTNRQNVFAGNPGLDPVYTHRLSGQYIRANPAKGRTFTVSAEATASPNTITDSLVIDSPDFVIDDEGTKLGEGNQYTKPVNLAGLWSLRASVNYGMPVRWLRSNLNFRAGISTGRIPSIINGERNFLNNNAYNAGLTLGSNISEAVDFRLSYTGRYNVSRSSSEVRTLDNTYFDAGEGNDLSGQLPYVDLSSDEYSFGIFHRSYAGLDPKGRFGLFAEFELALSTGHSSFAYDPDHNEGGAPNRTYNDKTQVKLAFNPGAAVYIFPNVCATISFGLGGIQYTSITQKDADGNKIGSRKASNMRFRLNIAAINFGMTIHLWDKKKQ